jgi:hypothetical protein
MKIYKSLLTFGIILLTVNIFPQQTLKVMSYNLLNYGNYWGDCSIGNNNVTNKNIYIHTIIDYVKPDIFAAIEMDEDPAYSLNLLNNALNIYGETKWKKGNPQNLSGAYLVNQIFYNSEKVQLVNTYNVQTNYRDIVIYRFKIIDDPDGTQHPLNCIVAHLKAGNGESDKNERKIEAELLMNFIDSYNLDGNNLLMGDFNFYTSSEPGYLSFLNYNNTSLRFYDPIHKPGNWNNNGSFKNYHTQSTHFQPGCPSGGGMDDRFDLILCSDEILNGSQQVQYLNNSYKTIGQDGQHFNKAINEGYNNSVPSSVLSALYNNSDHLPVTLSLKYGSTGIKDSPLFSQIHIPNPIIDEIRFSIQYPLAENTYYTLYDMIGREYLHGLLPKSFTGDYAVSTQNVNPGFYILKLHSSNGTQIQYKLLINKN